MKKYNYALFVAIIVAVIIFTGCKKEHSNDGTSSPNNSKSSTSSLSTNLSDSTIVNTPFGPRHKADVVYVEDGYALTYVGGHLQKVLKSTGKMVKDFGVQAPLKYLTTLNTGKGKLATFSTNATVPSLGSGWITDGSWTNSTGNPLTYFSTNWIVPSNPTGSDGQTLFLFNGLQDGTTSTSHILQPVLQWGTSAAGGGNYWSVGNWYAGCATCTALYTSLSTVSAGTNLQGVMQQTAQSGSNYSYSSSFVGYNSLSVSNVPQLYDVYETMEAYGMQQSSDYPADLKVNMSSISIKSGTADLIPSWTADNYITDIGQHTIVVSDSSPGGEVDLYFRNPVIYVTLTHGNATTTTSGTVKTSKATYTLSFFSDAAATHPLALSNPLSVIVNTTATVIHSSSSSTSSTTYGVPAGATTYSLGAEVIETMDSSIGFYGTTLYTLALGSNGTYTAD